MRVITLVCVIPKEAVLSVRTTAIADILAETDIPEVSLTFVELHDRVHASKLMKKHNTGRRTGLRSDV